VIASICEFWMDAGYDRTKYAGLVREIVDDVPRWAAPESDVIFTIDTSRLPVLKDLDSEVLGKIATKVRFLGTSARWAGVGFAFVSDWGDYKAGYQEAGWSGAFWEFGQTAAGVGGGLLASSAASGGVEFLCSVATGGGCGLLAFGVGILAYFVAQKGVEKLYANLVEHPPGLVEAR
jgi:hypothetical protein